MAKPAPTQPTTEDTRKNTTINLDADLLGRLKASAALQGIHLYEAFDAAVREYLANHPANIHS